MRAGDHVGPYVVLQPLGAGGMGEVFLATDTRLGRQVALKRLFGPAVAGDEGRQRLMREARAAAGLSHPNVATVHDVLDTPEGLTIVMEYVPGESLAERLARGPLPADEALRLGLQIADGLAQAHERGVIHRDLKPANIHVTSSGSAKILDFGIARSPSQAAPDAPTAGVSTSEFGRIVGSLGYMAPEQLAGGDLDARTDIYAVGILLFEALTGRRPFEEPDLLGNALAVFGRPLPRVGAIAPHIPPYIDALVARAMAREPAERFASARELSAALADGLRRLDAAGTQASGGTAPRRALTLPNWIGWRAAVGAAVVLAGLAAAAAVVSWSRPGTPVAAAGAAVGVLPFGIDPPDDANAALALGLTEAVARRLEASRALRLLSFSETRDAARSSRNPHHIARELGAAYVISGALRRDGSTLHVTVELSGADGQRHQAGTYTGSAANTLELDRRVSDGLLEALTRAGVLTREPARRVRPPTANREAFAEYAQARLFLERPDVPGNIERAVRLFQSAMAKDESFALAHAGLAEAYWAQFHETGDPQWTSRAMASNLEALRIDPDQPEVRMSLAVMYEGQGRAEVAIEELQKVITQKPDSDNPHRLLAGIYISQSRWAEAQAAAQRAIELRPNYWRNHSELGRAYYRAGDLARAAAAYARVTTLQPDSARGYQMLGTVLQSDGRLDEAVKNYEKALALQPSAATYSNLGTLHYWRGDYARAADAYEQAIAITPAHEYYLNLGDACARLRRMPCATQSYERAVGQVRKLLAVNPTDATNLAALALYHAKLEQPVPAGHTLDRALGHAPNDPYVLIVAAQVRALGRDIPAACQALGRAVAGGVSREVVRRADELQVLKGCPVYEAALRERNH